MKAPFFIMYRNKIKRIWKSKDVKVLIENFLSLSLLRIVSYILPFVTLPYIAKIIGIKHFGTIAFASSVIVFFQTFADFGFNLTGVRDIARVRDDRSKASQILFTIIFAKIILMLIGLIILIILIYIFPQFKDNATILLLSFLIIPGYVLYPEWFFQGIEKMKYSATLSTLIKIIFTTSIFLFIKKEEDYILIPVLNSIGYIFSGIIAFYIIVNKYKYRYTKVTWSGIYNSTKKSFNIFITLILPNLYTNMSTILLNNMWGKSATGTFDAGNKFTGISSQITEVISRTFFPFLSRRIDKHQIFERISFTISIIITILMYFGANLIVSIFYTSAYSEAAIIIKIMSLSPIFIFMMNAYGTNYLVIVGKERVLRNIVIWCSVFGLLLSYILVKRYSYIGAASTITAVWAVRGLLTWLFAKRVKHKLKQQQI